MISEYGQHNVFQKVTNHKNDLLSSIYSISFLRNPISSTGVSEQHPPALKEYKGTPGGAGNPGVSNVALLNPSG